MADFWEALVESPAGEVVAQIMRLTTDSLTLRNVGDLEPGATVGVTFFSVSIQGDVESVTPEGDVTITFTASDDIRERIVQRIREVHGPDADVDETLETIPGEEELAVALTSPISAVEEHTEKTFLATISGRPPPLDHDNAPATEPGGVPPLTFDDDVPTMDVEMEFEPPLD